MARYVAEYDVDKTCNIYSVLSFFFGGDCWAGGSGLDWVGLSIASLGWGNSAAARSMVGLAQ